MTTSTVPLEPTLAMTPARLFWRKEAR